MYFCGKSNVALQDCQLLFDSHGWPLSVNFKELSGLKIFSLTILAGRVLLGSKDGIDSNFMLEFNSKK